MDHLVIQLQQLQDQTVVQVVVEHQILVVYQEAQEIHLQSLPLKELMVVQVLLNQDSTVKVAVVEEPQQQGHPHLIAEGVLVVMVQQVQLMEHQQLEPVAVVVEVTLHLQVQVLVVQVVQVVEVLVQDLVIQQQELEQQILVAVAVQEIFLKLEEQVDLV